MAKLEVTDLHPQTRRGQHRSALRVLLIAAAIGLVMTEGAQATDHARDEFTVGAPPSRWRVSIPATGGRHASAILAAAETWTVHRARHRRPRATLTIRCVGKGELAAYVSFHDRVTNGDSVLRYSLGRGSPQRPSSLRQPLGTPEWLGGSRFVKDMLKAEMLEVVIEDVGLGPSEAVFMLAGAAGVVRRLESACRAQTRPLSAPSTSPPRQEAGRSPAPRSAEMAPSQSPSRPPEAPRRSRLQPRPTPSPKPPAAEVKSPEKPDPSSGPPPGASSPPGIVAERSGPPEEPSPAVIVPPERPGESEQPQATLASPVEDRPAPTQKDPGEVGTTVPPPAVAEPPAAPRQPPSPPPRDVEPPGDRLAAFLKRHGPNRKGEMIYGWYRQCLDHVGVDQEQVWYLSDLELTYLTKGERDQVRLSMLISTTRNVDIAPRRITCYGTARGREVTIDRSE